MKTSATNALVGKTFTSTSVDGAAIPGGGPLMLTFPEPGRVSLTAGCNRHIGPVTVDKTTLTIGELASTMMACPHPGRRRRVARRFHRSTVEVVAAWPRIDAERRSADCCSHSGYKRRGFA